MIPFMHPARLSCIGVVVVACAACLSACRSEPDPAAAPTKTVGQTPANTSAVQGVEPPPGIQTTASKPKAPGSVVTQAQPWYSAGRQVAVVTDTLGAKDAALKLLESGGSAADAAAAALLALTTGEQPKAQFGGSAVMLAYDGKTGNIEALMGQGAAPRRVGSVQTANNAAKASKPSKATKAQAAETPTASQTPDAKPGHATVPGFPHALITLIERHGRKTFKEIAKPTQELLKKGRQSWHWKLGRTLRKMQKAEKEADGQRLSGLRRAADVFYRGEIADEILQWSDSAAGRLQYADFATHTTRVEEPVSVKYRGQRVYQVGPPSQGLVVLAALATLDNFALEGLTPSHPRTIHLAVESLKLAFADRDVYYGDPRFSRVPTAALIYPYYMSLRGKLIALDSASRAWRPGNPSAKEPLITPTGLQRSSRPAGSAPQDRTPKSHQAATCVVVDGDGNGVVAVAWGAAQNEAGETGVFLGTDLLRFHSATNHPNTAEATKLPLTALSPTVVTDEAGSLRFALSVSDTEAQAPITLQLLLDLIDFKIPIDEAVSQPRWSMEAPIRLTVPESIDLKAGHQLRAMGHDALVAQTEIEQAQVSASGIVAVDSAKGIKRAAGSPGAKQQAGAY